MINTAAHLEPERRRRSLEGKEKEGMGGGKKKGLSHIEPVSFDE
jgi:hypothetical protein